MNLIKYFVKLSLLILACNNVYSQSQQCSIYSCDSTAVRAILDSNSLNLIKVEDVTSTLSIDGVKRIHMLFLDGKTPNISITKLPKDIGKISNLININLQNNSLTNLPVEIKNLASIQYCLNLPTCGVHVNGNNLCKLSSDMEIWLSNNTKDSWKENQICTSKLAIVQPNGGNIIAPLSLYEIKWDNSISSNTVLVEYIAYKDTIEIGQVTGRNFLLWLVPKMESDSVKIRISVLDDSVAVVSKSYFSVKSGSVNLLKENQGNIFNLYVEGKRTIYSHIRSEIDHIDIYNVHGKLLKKIDHYANHYNLEKSDFKVNFSNKETLILKVTLKSRSIEIKSFTLND